jgi:hypothetical protein
MISLWSYELAEKAFAMAPRYCKECDRNTAEIGQYCLDCYEALMEQQNEGEEK